MNQILCRFGKPAKVISDNGTEFINQGLQYLYEMWEIKPILTGGYNSQANPVERWHATLHPAMTTLSSKFGADWDTYLQAVVFNYNVSTCESTGYSPYSLMFGRDTGLLHEFHVEPADVNPKGSSDISSMRERMAKTLREAYTHVREKQRTDAEKSKLRRASTTYTTSASFTIGSELPNEPYDYAMLWEPQQPKMLAHDNGEEQRAPSKWTPKWTGPHKVVGKIENTEGKFHRYVIWHSERARKEKCHVNRLNKFDPWSQDRPSTSFWLDNRSGYEQGGFAHKDELFVIPLQKPFNFGVAKVLACSADGTVEYQWFGNANASNNGTFIPGWTRTTHPNTYYAHDRKQASHKPYFGNHDIPISQKDIILHGFVLTDGHKLPAPVRRALQQDVRIGGD